MLAVICWGAQWDVLPLIEVGVLQVGSGRCEVASVSAKSGYN
jgi:hypothetical protein